MIYKQVTLLGQKDFAARVQGEIDGWTDSLTASNKLFHKNNVMQTYDTLIGHAYLLARRSVHRALASAN